MSKPAPRVGAFKEASAYFRSRLLMTKEDWEKLSLEEQDKAFTLSGVSELDLVTQVWEALDRSISRGETFEDFKAAVGPALEEAWGAEDAYRLETIFRTNVQTAYNAGRWEQLTDLETREFRPYLRFLAVLDTRTTIYICRPIADTILPQEEPWWRTHWPPLHFSCRSTVLALTGSQADEMGKSTYPPHVQVQGDFGRTPDQKGYEPSLQGYPHALTHVYRSR